ncbi:hypothetical protein L6164_037515 [Bauhinia variegata]|uniref:Uncharacterized protein n=1 Tax=Bauhinia variegata TaxID=167791 RepID=A0ACB9KKG1_BAUVA|nr:hypothetical protein L6164_037515 [Bauhinia variegata]
MMLLAGMVVMALLLAPFLNSYAHYSDLFRLIALGNICLNFLFPATCAFGCLIDFHLELLVRRKIELRMGFSLVHFYVFPALCCIRTCIPIVLFESILVLCCCHFLLDLLDVC